MERCSFCQAALEEGAERCALCGQLREVDVFAEQTLWEIKPEPTLARCPACGKEQPAWSRFCRECGQPLGVLEEETAPASTSEFVLMPAALEGQEAEKEMPALLSDASGPPDVFSEFPGPYRARRPGMPPGLHASWPGAPAVPQPTPKRRSLRPAFLKRLTPKVIAAVLATVVVLAGIGAAAYILSRPRPVIHATSDQHTGATLLGSPDTVLHVTGQNFSANSAIIFLLDGQPAPGAPNMASDDNGAFTIDLTITHDWSFKTHTLTAKDAQGYVTHDGVTLRVLPQPVIAVTSSYAQGSTPAGAQGTVFDVSGKRFAPGASVTILLDDKPLALDQPLASDAKGEITTTLTVTADWTLGGHTIIAQDSQGYVTKSPASVVIVPQGVADTPGPNGAPADDASFSLSMNIQAKGVSNGQSASFSIYVDVTGRPDPAGGTVCNLKYDNGQPFTNTGQFTDGEKYTETMTTTCTGTYKSGHITYTETATSDYFVLADGLICSTHRAFVLNAIVGAYTADGFSGQYHSSAAVVPCNGNLEIVYSEYQGTWTGFL